MSRKLRMMQAMMGGSSASNYLTGYGTSTSDFSIYLNGSTYTASVDTTDTTTSGGTTVYRWSADIGSETSLYNASKTNIFVNTSAASNTIVYIVDDMTNVTEIGEYAFFKSTVMREVTLPDGLTTIGQHAFDYNPYLTSLSIPSSVTAMGDSAFRDCSRMTSAVVLCSTIGSNAFNGCTKLSSIVLSDNLTSIGANAFQYSIITSIDLPSSLTSIGNRAFFSCKQLASITIPSGVSAIEAATFYQCVKLASVTFTSATPPTVAQTTFEGCDTSVLTAIYVPSGTSADYVTALTSALEHASLSTDIIQEV